MTPASIDIGLAQPLKPKLGDSAGSTRANAPQAELTGAGDQAGFKKPDALDTQFSSVAGKPLDNNTATRDVDHAPDASTGHNEQGCCKMCRIY